jgi:hypothetical protein
MATQQPARKKRTFDVRYVPDYVQRQIAGAKGQKKSGRPFIFDVRNFKVDTQSDGTVIGTYLLFGGVPPKGLHEKLEAAGFKVRRRQASYTDKDGNVHTVDGNERECYAVYYNTENTPTKAQAQLIGNLLLKTLNLVADKGKSFLLPTWEAIDKSWEDRENWLAICTVEPEEESPAAGTTSTDEDDQVLNIDDLDEMF